MIGRLMIYVKHKRLCVQAECTPKSFFRFSAAQNQYNSTHFFNKMNRKTYKSIMKRVITESCPGSPGPVCDYLGGSHQKPAPELKS